MLVMYEKVGMSGRAVTYDGAVADIDVRYPFHSASVKSGRWELCTRNNFKGACMDIEAGSDIVSLKKEFGIFARIRSVRPAPDALAQQAPQPALPVPQSVSAPEPSESRSSDWRPAASAEAALRGHGAGFFKTPMLNGAPIDYGNEEPLREFCREAGFESMEFSAPAFIAGRSIVGDLLCAGTRDSTE